MTNQPVDPALIQFWRQRGESAGHTIGQRVNSYGPAVFEYQIDWRGDLHSVYMSLSEAERVVAEEAFLSGFEAMTRFDDHTE